MSNVWQQVSKMHYLAQQYQARTSTNNINICTAVVRSGSVHSFAIH